MVKRYFLIASYYYNSYKACIVKNISSSQFAYLASYFILVQKFAASLCNNFCPCMNYSLLSSLAKYIILIWKRTN